MAATCNYFSCLPPEAPQLSESGLAPACFPWLKALGASRAWLTDWSLGVRRNGACRREEFASVSLLSYLDGRSAPCPSAVSCRLDPEAKLLVFIFLLRVLSAVSLLGPFLKEESDLWQVWGFRVCAVTLFLFLV